MRRMMMVNMRFYICVFGWCVYQCMLVCECMACIYACLGIIKWKNGFFQNRMIGTGSNGIGCIGRDSCGFITYEMAHIQYMTLGLRCVFAKEQNPWLNKKSGLRKHAKQKIVFMKHKNESQRRSRCILSVCTKEHMCMSVMRVQNKLWKKNGIIFIFTSTI